MKKTLAALGISLLIVGVAYLAIGWRNGAKGSKYRTDPVERGEIAETVLTTGTVNAVTTVSVGSQVSGTIV